MRKVRLIWSGAFVVLMAIWAGCAVENGVILQLQDVPALDGQCVPNPGANEFVTQDVFDPSGGTNFALFVRVLNRLADPEADPVRVSGGTQNVRVFANDLLVRGFEACWYREAELQGTPSGKSPFFNCDTFPESQRGFFVSSGTIESGSAPGVAGTTILGVEELQGLYGSDFDPVAVAANGFDPADAAWGDYPVDANFGRSPDPIVIQARLVTERQSGQVIRSNWITHPMEISVGAAQAVCGFPMLVLCDEPCGAFAETGSTCDAGTSTCMGGTLAGQPCTLTALAGQRPDPEGCLPFQGQGGFLCEMFTNCL